MASSLLRTYDALSPSSSILSAPTADSQTTKTSISRCSSGFSCSSKATSLWFHFYRPLCLSAKAYSLYNKGFYISFKTHIAMAALKKNPYKQYFPFLSVALYACRSEILLLHSFLWGLAFLTLPHVTRPWNLALRMNVEIHQWAEAVNEWIH